MRGPSSLRQQALNACIKQVRYIEDVGDAPYDFIRPVLIKVTNADQLRSIERNSPQVVGHSAEIWHKIIKHDAPSFDPALHTPGDPAKWWKVHRKLVREAQADLEEKTKIFKERQDKAKQERQSAGVLDRIVVPQKSRRAFTTTAGGGGAGFSFGGNAAAGPRLKAGQAMLRNAKKDASANKRFSKANPMLASSKPSSWAAAGRTLGKVAKVPHGMADKLDAHEAVPSYSRASDADHDKQPAASSARTVATGGAKGAAANPTPAAAAPRPKRPAQNIFMPAKKKQRV